MPNLNQERILINNPKQCSTTVIIADRTGIAKIVAKNLPQMQSLWNANLAIKLAILKHAAHLNSDNKRKSSTEK